MPFFLTALSLLIAIIAGTAAFIFFLHNRRAQAELELCSERLNDIFKLLGESSAVTRILSLESPHQELVRLHETLQNKNQSALRESQMLYQALDSLPEGLIALGPSHNVVFCNAEFCRIMKIPEKKHDGKKIFELLRHHAALTAAESFMKNDSTESLSELEFVTAGGNSVLMRMIRVNADMGTAAIFVFSDTTALKKLESLRRDFVANVSHELKTPLTSIQGFVETLLDGAAEDPATRTHFLGLMRKDAERLRRLIEDLLLLSRIENQSRDFEKQEVDFIAESEETLQLFSLRMKEKKISVQKKIEKGTVVSAQQDSLRQVLVNLIDNAVKFTPEEGVIGIEAQQRSDGVEIKVWDSGVGVLPENRENVFQRFFREDRARSRETGGTGLGLAIVKHIIEAHGGKVRCEAGPNGVGAAFVLFFPVG